MAAGAHLNVHWCVLSARAARADEAAASAKAFLARAAERQVELCEFHDGYFPYGGAALKDWFEGLKLRVNPDVVLTHWRGDAHQDHREVSALTWNSFRDHLILEYEIPKWDGDIGQPNFYVPLGEDILARKIELLDAHFGSQRSKDWFSAETFRGLARLRGMEARAPSGFAESFFARKVLAG
jgi:LmbE family N-acetylglucosaminyl deacetylase